MANKKIDLSCPMPEFDFNTITLEHGSGGQLMHRLLEDLIFKLFANKQLDQQHDGAIVQLNGSVAFSTDSYVVSPIFFPGGNIGDLAINGTMNDIAMCGAIPKYISLGLIVEEGLQIDELWKVLESIYRVVKSYQIEIVTGDTKVVERGKGDKLFINTTGIGEVLPRAKIGIEQIREGDHVLVSGNIGSHGMAVMSVREGLEFKTSLQSDTQYIGDISAQLINTFGDKLRFMRDPTRGGLATVLNEITSKNNMSIELEDQLIPVLPQTRSACELLGLDPVYVANEGVFVAVVAHDIAETVLMMMKSFHKCADAAYIGKVTSNFPKKVIVKSGIGGKRVIPMLIGEQLPRIC